MQNILSISTNMAKIYNSGTDKMLMGWQKKTFINKNLINTILSISRKKYFKKTPWPPKNETNFFKTYVLSQNTHPQDKVLYLYDNFKIS